MDPASVIGRSFFAVAMVAFGVLHLVYMDFVTRVVPWWPGWLAGRAAWAGVVGLVLIIFGAEIGLGRKVQRSATLLGFLILLSFFLLGLPAAIAGPVLGGEWTRAGKALAFSGGAFLVALASAGAVPDSRAATLGVMGRWFLGAFLLVCGIQHFVHLEFVTTLVPAYMPARLFWAQFAGVALIAGGIGIVVPRTTRLAGTLDALMIFAWVFMVHIPRAVAAGTRGSNETTAVFEALAMSGIALLAATTTSAAEKSFHRSRAADHVPVTSM
jgi:uncharacterized membrane protein